MTKDLKILYFDLENVMKPEHIFHPGKGGRFGGRAAGFCADLAYILSFGYKWHGEKAQSIELTKEEWKKDRFDDTPILKKAYEIMHEADVVVTWYGSGHDFPFLASRMARIGLYLDPNIKHVDMYQAARKRLRLSSNRLDAAAKFFNLETKMDSEKIWWPDCWAGKYDSLMKMAEYCRQDCEVLALVADKLKGMGTNLPHMGAAKGKCKDNSCSACGSERVFYNGKVVNKHFTYRRLRCYECGASTKGEVIKDERK